MSTTSRGGFSFKYSGEHRDGYCEKCNAVLERVETQTDYSEITKHYNKKVTFKCPACGHDKGHLIARVFTIEPPAPPECLSIKCLFKFEIDSLYCAFLASYHRRRVYYAEHNRHKKILERYRTGEPSPRNLYEAIHANLKLACPVCRKFDADPLLFGGK